MTHEANAAQGQNSKTDPRDPPSDSTCPKEPPDDCEPPETDPCNPPSDADDSGKAPKKCKPLDPGPKAPGLCPPKPCEPKCCCPSKPESTDTCLDLLIDEQAKLITTAERAKLFKSDLEDILKKAKAARLEYNKEKHKDLRAKWESQDTAIAELSAKLICAVPCWWCLVECEICPLLEAIRVLELEINGEENELIEKVFSLRDLRYWQERNRDAKKEVFDRIKRVLTAWEKPAQTLDKILTTDNAKAIEDIKKTLTTDAAMAVHDLIMKVVPIHLAIAPRGVTSKVLKVLPKYGELCCCDRGKPDDCCGPDVGRLSIRQGLVGPLPYLVEPEKLLEIICCLAEERYLPAKNLLAAAEADLAKTESEIKRKQTDLDQRRTSIAADYKLRVANPICCDNYKPKADKTPEPPESCKPASNAAPQTTG